MNGSGCTPNQIYISEATYYNEGGAVAVKEDSSAVFNCPVTIGLSRVGPSQLTVVSSGATTSPAHTTAALMAVSRSAGFETEIATVTATSGSAHGTSSLFTHNFSEDDNFYFVRVTMTSGSVPGQIQTLFGVSLE